VDAVKLRYRAKPVPAVLDGDLRAGRHPELLLRLGEPVARPAPGQAAVMLSGGRIVGSATVAG
jgi:tRNA-uridine 2-sulfurtransferase